MLQDVNRSGTQHEEAGQTFDQFSKARRNQPTKERRWLYFQPLGKFDEASHPVAQYPTAAPSLRGSVPPCSEPWAASIRIPW